MARAVIKNIRAEEEVRLRLAPLKGRGSHDSRRYQEAARAARRSQMNAVLATKAPDDPKHR